MNRLILLVESRIRGDVYVRFGGELPKTHRSNTAGRWMLSLPFVFLVCTLLWQLFDVNEIEDFVFRLIKVTEYQPIDNSIVVGVFVSLCALWFADRSSTKDIIFRHKDSDRYILKEVPITSIIFVLDILLANNPSINFFYMKF